MIGALPFFNNASASAREEARVESQESRVESGESRGGEPPQARRSQESRVESGWLDDYSKPVGLTYSAQATLNAAYLWRGLYVGAANLQASASVGYGGLYADLWWNIGTTDWRFNTFQPEMDITIGFNRWGLNAYALLVHNFNCGLFDFSNRVGSGGNSFEVGARYTVSSKLPLSFLWATRLSATDGYIDAIGDTIRAYSTYAEISYTHALPHGLSLYGAIGITPWKSVYTGYQRDFAVQNIEIRLRKDWDLSKHCGLKLQGVLSINPSALAADKSSAQWHPYNPGNQSINANICAGVYLK